ncbi:hypothetical protein Gotri_019461 [Gossypium trilobum]|uniref:RNase H type-1 domain-containing protein n=1 Tax=Gossypium trilobum TaxID=34281 RepID=A0A7J9ED05_9ROSI|nr:hypothetical protein [Gossypium trilobum]
MGIALMHGSVNEFVAQMLIEQQNDKRRRVLGMLWVIEGGDVCWRKQTIGMLKCNVDEATFVDSGQMGWDAIVHNNAGGFVRCTSGSMKSGRNPSMTEILAVREDVS